MKTITFIAISIFSGIIAGEILASINLFVVEPYLDKAIGIEIKNKIAKGETINFDQFNYYRIWQKSGSFFAGALLGITFGCIMGIAYIFYRKLFSSPSFGDIKKAVTLAALMCLSFYIIPFIKYPANPPTVGNPETIGFRDHLYIGYQTISVLVTFGVGIMFYKFRKINNQIPFIILAIYLVLVTSLYIVFPSNTDKITISMDLVNSFRIVTLSTMIVFWLVLGFVFGLLWRKFKPHESTKITIH